MGLWTGTGVSAGPGRWGDAGFCRGTIAGAVRWGDAGFRTGALAGAERWMGAAAGVEGLTAAGVAGEKPGLPPVGGRLPMERVGVSAG